MASPPQPGAEGSAGLPPKAPAQPRNYSEFVPFGSVTDFFDWKPHSSKLGEGTYVAALGDGCKITPKRVLDQAQVYLVLEYIDGGELFDFIIKRGYLSEQEAMQITKQLMEALRYLHSDQKIVHRDLKPENILMVKDTMQIKVIDFGFAKFFGQHTTSSQILKRLLNHGVQPRVTTRNDIQKLDVFAAGVITYVMLSGTFPFSSKMRSVLAQQIENGPKFPDRRWSNVSEDAKAYCRWLLDPDRRNRPLAHDTFGHPWLMVVAPETPLEWPESGDSDPIDNQFFDEIRGMDDDDPGAEPAPTVNPGAGAQVVPPKPEKKFVLKPPKKGDAKKVAGDPASSSSSSPSASPASDGQSSGPSTDAEGAPQPPVPAPTENSSPLPPPTAGEEPKIQVTDPAAAAGSPTDAEETPSP